MQLNVIKIGGNIIDDPCKLQQFVADFATLPGNKILVHGGGKVATSMGERLGIESHYVNGRRITDAATLELVTMVYGGLINKNMVAALQAYGCNALGLTGADANILPAHRRPAKDTDYGYVGDVRSADVQYNKLAQLLQIGLTPVLAPLTHDGKGSLLNTNADTIAQEAAKALSAIADVQLIYCFEKKGVLRDAADDNSAIAAITRSDFDRYVADGTVSGGMIPKLENAFTAIASGVKKVIIGQAEELEALCAGTTGTSII